LVSHQYDFAFLHPFLCGGDHSKPKMGDEVSEMERTAGRFKILFGIAFLALAVLMFGGSHYLGKESVTTLQSTFFHRGVPQQFAYLDQKQSLLAWNPIHLRKGSSLPPKSFLLTFDDGRKDSYYPVDPILKALNYRAVMFVITSNISEQDNFYLSEAELKEMVASGRWELGSHGKSIHELKTIGVSGQQGHPLSNLLWDGNLARQETPEEYKARIQADLSESKHELESRFGISVNSFAFPYGDMGQGSLNNPPDTKEEILQSVKSNFDFAFYQPWEETVWRNYPGQDTFLIRRMEVNPAWTATDLMDKLDGGIDKPLDFLDTMQRNAGWSGGWGKTDFSPGTLSLSATHATTGATAFLDGTRLWGDITLVMTIHLVQGESVSLLARGDAFHNYVYCSFGRHGISYGEQFGGADIQGPNWSSNNDLLSGEEETVRMTIQGDHVLCSLNGLPYLQTRMISSRSDQGRVGISVWSARAGEAILKVTSFSAIANRSFSNALRAQGIAGIEKSAGNYSLLCSPREIMCWMQMQPYGSLKY
jgi:peptidoglycan/xylan/chitin deacetylase (PgdA/CDA1 family)